MHVVGTNSFLSRLRRFYTPPKKHPEDGPANSRTTPMIETPAGTSSNFPVNQLGEGKAMLKDFVHGALTKIGSDSTMDELLLYSPFDDDQPTLALQQHEGSELSTGTEHAACTQSITERRELIEEQNREYNEALKADQQKEHEIEKEQENASEMGQLRREREAKVPDEPHIEEDHVVVLCTY